MLKSSLFALVVLGACSSSPSGQIITGRVATDFPTPVTAVRVLHQGAIVGTSPVAADGTFQIAAPAQKNLAFQLVSGAKSKLVFPRHVGGNQTLFAVRGGGTTFDLGTIHFVGDVTTTTIVFHDGTISTDCEDGHDASGAVCADDQDSSGGSCDAEGDNTEQEGMGSDDVNDGLADDGDAVPEHNFPADGCADGESSDGSGDSGSGN